MHYGCFWGQWTEKARCTFLELPKAKLLLMMRSPKKTVAPIPTTAMVCLGHVGQILGQLCRLAGPSLSLHHDEWVLEDCRLGPELSKSAWGTLALPLETSRILNKKQQ